jgi:hypothetical protein
MPPSTAEVRPETSEVQDIIGGTCPLAPIQVCILWAARQEKIISPLAFKVYFASHEVKFWRSKTKPGETYHYEPYGFELTDLSRLLPSVPETKIARAFGELESINVLNMTDRGIWFAESLDDVTVNERVQRCVLVMFNQLHENTRDKIVKIPRRLLKLIVQCGKRIVRAATLIGMLLTTVLTKRTEKYGGYKGCCKAEWIGKVFGVNVKRVNVERAKLINEGWFTREPTTPRARKKYGQWVRLNLTPAQPTPDPEKSVSEETISEQSEIEELTIEEPLDEISAIEIPDAEESTVEAPLVEVSAHEVLDAEELIIIDELPHEPFIVEIPDTEELAFEELISEQSASKEPDPEELAPIATPEVQPQNRDFEPQVQPLPNLSLSSSEVILRNQELSPGDPEPGAEQPKDAGKPSWTNIQPNDLHNDAQSEKLWEEAIRLGHLKPNQANRINFFAAIAHALRVAKNNACGLLRTIVEKGLWHFISQADEYNALQRLRCFTESQETKDAQRMPANPFLTTNADRVGKVDEQPIELSEDALIVQTLTADLNRAGVKGDIFGIVRRNGYLRDWDKERWLQAEQEIAQARLLQARQRYEEMKMTSIGDVFEEGIDDDESLNDD